MTFPPSDSISFMPDSFMLLHMNSCHPSAPAVAVAHLCPRCSLRYAVSFLLLSLPGLLSLHCLGASSAMLTCTGTDLEVWGSQHSPEWTLTKGGKSQRVKLPSPVPFTCILRTPPGGRPHMLTRCSLLPHSPLHQLSLPCFILPGPPTLHPQVHTSK